MSLKIVAVTLLLFLQLHTACAREPSFTHYTVKDGLLNSTVYYAMQDSRGFIWFCTETGVNRFDGRKFEPFTIKNGLADNTIFKCFEDSRSRIWFLSYNGQLSYFYRGKIFNKENTPWLAYKNNGSFLIDCVEDKSGVVWFNTSLGDVLKVKDTTVSVTPSPVPEQQHNYNYFSAKLFSENSVAKKLTLIGNRIYESDLLSQQRSLIDSLPDFLHAAKFRPLRNDRTQPHYFMINGTLVKYRDNKFELLDNSILKTDSRLLSFLSDTGTFWLGTAGDGCARITYGPKNEPVADYVLKGEAITSILKDADGNVWFTTHGNSVFLLKNNANNITVLSSGPSYSIASIKYGGLQYNFVGRDHGMVSMYNGLALLRSSTVLPADKLDHVSEIIRLDSTRVAFFSTSPVACIYNMRTGVYMPLQINQGLKAGYVDAQGGTWICTQEYIRKLQGDTLRNIMHAGPLGKLLAFAAVSDTVFYVGTASKLFKVTKSAIVRTVINDTVLKGGVADLKIADDMLWVATHGNGVFLLRQDSIVKHITTENGLTSDVCQKLYDDRKQYIWLGTNNGISIIDRHDGAVFHNLSAGSGLISDDINNICVSGDSIFTSSPAGVNVFRLNDMIYNTPPPKVYITALKTGARQLTDPGDSVSFRFYKGFLNIQFTALDYEAPLDNRYEYKFEHDKEWQRTQITEITLFGLPPGIHKLLVRAKKYNSGWSSPVVFTLNVLPLWYQSLWFAIVVGAMLMLCLYLLFMSRIRHVRQQAEKQNRYEKQITELESKSLAYQMNPHFIFNSLNTVQQFMLTKNERAGITYLGEFSKLMRQILENSKKPLILLSEEIAFLRRYMELERTRYSDSFTYSIIMEDALENEEIKIPPMLFQPLLENAVKHGVASIEHGYIELNLRMANGILIATVSDNGTGIYHVRETVLNAINRESTALKVLEERVKLIKDKLGRNGSFSITDKSATNGSGTSIEIMIPLDPA